jgi:uncharacterized membrane protein YfcA
MQYLVIGIVAGILSGLFGIGGGTIIVPALILIAHMKPHMATGTSLGALLLPVGVLGAWQYYAKGSLDIRVALWIALGIALGALLGAYIALKLPPRELQRLFAVFLLFIAVRMWMTA